MAWYKIATDGEPPSDLSGNLTPYFVYDATSERVMLVGRVNDQWLIGKLGPTNVTHWQPVEFPDPPEG